MRIALIHDWLNGMRGGERVLEAICELYPSADIFTLFAQREKLSSALARMPIRTSFVQQLPFVFRAYRWFLPVFPLAAEGFDLRGYDLVISTSHCVAKGVRPAGAGHICYCFTPMRYVWFLTDDYLGTRGGMKRWLSRPVLSYLRRWDRSSSRRVDHFVGISKNVAGRIEAVYNRSSGVLYPPVDTEYFRPSDRHGDYFLVVSALVPYKRVDLAVETFNRLGLPLKIVGTGPLARTLKQSAAANIEFLGWIDDLQLRDYYRGCRALIFPGVEDFGIVPLEAMACGRPVIGLGKGGLLETAVPWTEAERRPATAVFFYRQEADSLAGAVKLFIEKEREFDPAAIRRHARDFDRRLFKERFSKMVSDFLKSGRRG